MELRYPNMREELIEILRAFSDRSYQERFWLRRELPVDDWKDDFGENIDMFLDILPDYVAPNQIVGVLLYNQEELEAVQSVKATIYNVLGKLGRGFHIPDETYIKSLYWSDVVNKAHEAYILLTGGKDPEGYFEYIQAIHNKTLQ